MKNHIQSIFYTAYLVIYRRLVSRYEKLSERMRFRRIGKKKAIILGTPSHTNIGDSAIVVAEFHFLNSCGIAQREILEITVSAFRRWESRILQALREHPSVLICWHGGGNMGDQWKGEETFRRETIEKLSGRPMIIFPQTIYYSDTESGKAAARDSIKTYDNQSCLTIAAREKPSFEVVKALYPHTDTLLVPDTVLRETLASIGAVPSERSGVLMCLRRDPEKKITEEAWTKLEAYLDQSQLPHRRTDMYSQHFVTPQNRVKVVRRKMQEFCGAGLVITDRLHGMVFAAISETPCVVFTNYNHKVRGTYEWIRHLPYIRFADSVEDAEQLIPELLAMKDCSYDSTPFLPYYEKLREVVAGYVKD